MIGTKTVALVVGGSKVLVYVYEFVTETVLVKVSVSMIVDNALIVV